MKNDLNNNLLLYWPINNYYNLNLYTFAHPLIMIIMLKKEFQYFLDNQSDLVDKYNNKFIVIKDQKVIGSYDSHSEAYSRTSETEEIGTFLIQHCLPGNSAYTQTFHSQVIISSLA